MHDKSAVVTRQSLTVLIVVPTLHAGAAEMGAVDLVRILTEGGHQRHRHVARRTS